MDGQGLLVEAAVIGGNTPLKDMIVALTGRSCKDFTPFIDPDGCSKHPLARGGFCDVFQGKTRSGERIAIKCLRQNDNLSEDDGKNMLKRAARELYSWSKLKHPNVLPLLGLAVFRAQLSMVSEWMENGHLRSYIKKNPKVDRMKLCIDVCSGMSYLHSEKMAHGDIKGTNVMISQNGVAMIADFGTARLNELTLKFTGTTSTVCTTRWAAPELFGKENHRLASKEADVYAYGMVVLEALTGEAPFMELSDLQATRAVISGEIPNRPESVAHDELWELMKNCWRRDYPSRPDAITVGKAMQAYHNSLRNRRPGSARAPVQKRSTSRLPKLLLILGCLIPVVAFYSRCQMFHLCSTYQGKGNPRPKSVVPANLRVRNDQGKLLSPTEEVEWCRWKLEEATSIREARGGGWRGRTKERTEPHDPRIDLCVEILLARPR